MPSFVFVSRRLVLARMVSSPHDISPHDISRCLLPGPWLGLSDTFSAHCSQVNPALPRQQETDDNHDSRHQGKHQPPAPTPFVLQLPRHRTPPWTTGQPGRKSIKAGYSPARPVAPPAPAGMRRPAITGVHHFRSPVPYSTASSDSCLFPAIAKISYLREPLAKRIAVFLPVGHLFRKKVVNRG